MEVETLKPNATPPTRPTSDFNDEHTLMIEELLLLEEYGEEYEDTIYLASYRAETICEKRLGYEERKQFSQAKDEALVPWIDNRAWERVRKEDVNPDECVPMIYLLKWKQKAEGRKANARVILQGFKHIDVLTQKLDTESPTLSRLGRNMIFQFCVTRKWKVFSADVKSAFLQSEDIENRVYGIPSADMRRRLERMIDLQPDEILLMKKPAFGDVRAPKQWWTTADSAMADRHFVSHPLDNCLYLSTRLATDHDDEFDTFMHNSQKLIVDGVLGLHVDDFIGGGESIASLQDIKPYEGEELYGFVDRIRSLNQRFRFGSWDFAHDFVFCGGHILQSPLLNTIDLSMKEHIRKIKPITIDKARRSTPMQERTQTEHRALRSCIGALQWPAAQGVVFRRASPLLRLQVTIPRSRVCSTRTRRCDSPSSMRARPFASRISDPCPSGVLESTRMLRGLRDQTGARRADT